MATLSLGLLATSAPTRAHAKDGEVRAKPRPTYVQTTFGTGGFGPSDRAAECTRPCGTGGLSGGGHVGGAVASWLVVGGGLTVVLFPDRYDTGFVGVVGPFAQVWIDADRTAYARVSGGLTALRTWGAQEGPSLGFALGWEPFVNDAWTVGPALQAVYAKGIFRRSCERGCDQREIDLWLFTLGHAVTHR